MGPTQYNEMNENKNGKKTEEQKKGHAGWNNVHHYEQIIIMTGTHLLLGFVI